MENLKNNNQSPVNPTTNVAQPNDLSQRIEEQSSKANHPKTKKGIFVLLVFLFVLIGVGGWWYYAQGQAWMMVKQVKWNWGLENLEHYQQDTSLSLEIKSKAQGEQDMYSMLFNNQKFNLDISTQQKNTGLNLESDTNIKAKAPDLDLNVGFKTKKIEDKLYLLIDTGDMKDLFGGLIPIPDFGDTWLEVDVENSYNIALDEEKLTKVNILFNDYLDDLKSQGVFKIKDLKKDKNGLRKIQLNVKENKIDTFILLSINYSADIYEIVSEVDKASLNYKDYRKNYQKDFEKFKKEKPSEWQKMQEMFEDIDFMLLIDEDTKSIHGLELYFNNVVFNSGSSSTIINGNIKHIIKTIEAYDISKPTNVKKINELKDIYETSIDESDVEEDITTKLKETDTDQDGLNDYLESIYGTSLFNPDTDGDGYLDGEEVENGYNPLGEGELEVPTFNLNWSLEGDFDDSDYDLETKNTAFVLACTSSGGEWVILEDISELECVVHTEEFVCSSDGCIWDPAANVCFSDRNHCLCPDGSQIWSDSDIVILSCDNIR